MLEKESKKGRIIWGKVRLVLSPINFIYIYSYIYVYIHIYIYVYEYTIVMVFRVKIFIIMH